jgi:hypothetical protein
MSLASNILCGFKIIGMTSGGYIGYKYGNEFKKWCYKNSTFINRYYNLYLSGKFRGSQIPESMLFNLIGCLSGVLIGFYIWPVSIPVSISSIADDYPEEFKKIRKFIRD